MDLRDTVEGMLSDKWEERILAEYQQLCIRMDRIEKNAGKMGKKETYTKKEVMPMVILTIQYKIMESYKDVLEERMRDAGINYI